MPGVKSYEIRPGPTLETSGDVVERTFERWQEDRVSRMAASLAYWSVFSLPPLLVIMVAVAGLVVGENVAESQVIQQAQVLMGQRAADTIATMIDQTQQQGGGVLGSIVSLVILIVSATTLFSNLQKALNDIWGVEPEEDGVEGFLQKRVLSFLMILFFGLLLIGSLFFSTLLSTADGADVQLPASSTVLQVVEFLVMVLVLTLVFAATYRVLPDAEIPWADAFVGALPAAVLFNLGKILLSWYLSISNLASTYGAAGTLVVVLVWAFFSAVVLLTGAELAEVVAQYRGDEIVPAEGARVSDVKRIQAAKPRAHAEA